jgi:cell wall-associated NlpC family hydrolase
MRRLLVLLTLAVVAAPAAAEGKTLGNWNPKQQKAVAAAGLIPRLGDGRFHGERPLTGPQLSAALRTLAEETGVPPIAGSSAARISVTGFNARLVGQLGLSDVAFHVQDAARAAGLKPPPYFGTEVVARFLGLRYNHPAADDRLYPWEPITRAEAAHSFATILRGGSWAIEHARARLSEFRLPRYDAATKRALRVAVAKIGMPYVWGGETDAVSSTFGYQAHGGYDCSGFVWRVFKLSGHPAGARIGGRTAAQMAGEIPKSRRVRWSAIKPGDLLFFGSAKFGSKATEANTDHVGIALSEEWMIHSSSQGVYVSALDGWRQDRFTWARRVL